ncbi:dUTP diphosphatase [Blattabacterium cuenoti]|nr:dUTP diphosphatase [Blattabacterium cuenoti]
MYQSTLISNIKKSISINFLERKLISTGIFFIYENTKYSFFLKKKMIKTVCIIHITKNKKKHFFYDEIQIIIINVFPEKNIIIEPNNKIGVLGVVKHVKIKWKKCSILNISMRGDNSFGSTGIL